MNLSTELTETSVADPAIDEPAPNLTKELVLALENPSTSTSQVAAASPTPATVYTVNLTVREYDENDPGNGPLVTDFSYLVNEDNTGTAFDGHDNLPSYKPMASYSPIVAAGSEIAGDGSVTIGLPDIEPSIFNPLADQLDRYLISIRAPGYKSWGHHVRFPDDDPDGNNSVDVTIELIPEPLPLASLRVFAFRDFAPVDGFPNFPLESDGLAGFHVILEDVAGEVVVDWEGNPICSENANFVGQQAQNENGYCVTDQNGEVFIEGIPHGKYEVFVIPPNGSDWVQTTTFEGTKAIDAWLEEGSDGRGAPGEILIEPNAQTAFFFGFTRGMNWGDPDGLSPGNSEIRGTVRNLVPFPPFEQLTFGEPVVEPWVTLTDIGRTDQQVYRTRGDENGEFVIPNVPAGTYQMTYWDEPMDYIIAFRTVTVGENEVINVNQVDARGEEGLGSFRWFAWLSGYVFDDSGLTTAGDRIDGLPLDDPTPNSFAGNGIRDCLDMNNQTVDSCEPGFAGAEVVTKYRDGSVQKATTTDGTNRPGFYEIGEVRGPLGKMVLDEVDFGRYERTGHSIYSERHALFNNRNVAAPTIAVGDATGDLYDILVVDPDAGGGLILSQEFWEGRRTMLDWGKRAYEPGNNGGISGVVLYATTRNEFEARLQAAEDYEPGVPGVMIRLWGLGTDGEPGTDDDVLLNEVETDSWQDPGSENPDNDVRCDVLDLNGVPLPGATADFIAEHCLEVPQLGNETKPGAYDGGWAMEEACDTGITRGSLGGTNTDDPLFDPDAVSCTGPLPPGDYVVEMVEPHFYQIVKEEDINVAEGHELFFVPQFPPPECVGPTHSVDDSVFATTYPASPFIGQDMPLCNLRLVTLKEQQNAGLEFYLFTDTDTDHDPTTRSWTSPESVPPPARFYGLVEDDLRLNLDPNSINYGEPRGVPHVPISVRDYKGRVLTTVYSDENGYYEVMIPTSAQADCPIPGGLCPQMYVLVVNDPGDLNNPDPNFSNEYLTEPAVFETFPGKMRWTDTPVDPINTLVCTLPPETPQIFAADQVYGPDTGFEITLTGTRFGTTLAPTVPTPTYNDPVLTPTVTLSGTVLPVVSWTPATPFGPDLTPNTGDDFDAVFEDAVTVQVPNDFPVGPQQLMVTNNHSGLTSVNGLTIHVLGGSYNPPVVTVSPPADVTDTVIQSAIDGAATDSLIVIEPGTYRENVIVHKRVKLQGHGPGGVVGAGNLEPIDCPNPANPGGNCPAPTQRGEEPFGHVLGTVIDGRFYQFDETRRSNWEAVLAASGSVVGPADVPGGAGVTVVANSTGEFDVADDFEQARIDGLGITGARGFGGGGVYVHAYGRNLQISNNIFEVNSSTHGGAISLGRPLAEGGADDNENDNIHMYNNRMLSNGGIFFAGGVGIFNGADNYEFNNNDVCGNFSAEYGGGVSHFGLSEGGNIHDNQIYYNDSFDEGGGIMIGGDPGTTPNGIGSGSGAVNVEDNIIHLNAAGDDGGGLMLLNPLDDHINIVNNMINNNAAADAGGGITLDRASAVEIVNNTVVGNISTSTAEDAILGEAHTAGIASHFITGEGFPDPVMFNNIIWDNLAYSWDTATATLVPTAFIDLEVTDGGPGDCLDPTYSFLSVDYGPDAGACTTTDPSNIIGGPAGVEGDFTNDPSFVRRMSSVTIPASVAPNRQNMTELLLTVDRPEGSVLSDVDYHLNPGSLAIDAGIDLDPRGSGVTAPCDDFDDDARPNNGLWDMGADEQPGAVPTGECQAMTLNLPPIVDAGPDQEILTASTTLEGLVTDDGVTPVTTTWTLASATDINDQPLAATVTFSPSPTNTLTPTVTFSDPGEYVLRLTADDGFNPPVSDDVLIGVQQLDEGFIPVPAADLYLSLQRNTANPGPLRDNLGNPFVARDEDIIGWVNDGTNGGQGSYVMVFDGSDVGVGGTDVTAFDIDLTDALGELTLGSGRILMAFASATTINDAFTDIAGNLTVEPHDIVMFTPAIESGLGDATAGTFSLLVDGSTVGLTTNGERLDGISRLSGDEIVISTRGNVNVSGASGQDEDLLRYNLANGTWSLYFDGSNNSVGLSNGNAEDVNGVDIDLSGAGVIYLTTRDAFEVPYPALINLTGENEDVFVCTPTSLGQDTTGCDYTPLSNSFNTPLFFDGNTRGVTANTNNGLDLDIDGITIGPGSPTP